MENEYLHVNTCGKQKMPAGITGSFRPFGRSDWHLLYIDSGVCYITENGKEIAVESGNFIFYRPGEPQRYDFKEHSDAVSYFIHFSGAACDYIFEKLEFPQKRVIFVGKDIEIKQMLDSLVYEFSIKQKFYTHMCNGHLMNILSLISRKVAMSALQSRDDFGKTVTDVCRYMYDTHTKNLPVSEYAKMCSLSESRFSHLFKDMMGVSPKQYIINIQMQKAKELLETTRMPISQISDVTGMQNQNYFSRIFKKYTKMSPSAWRNSH